ncbi:MAG: hypothetical protein JXK07_03405 [Spirochaetes bacterium]|nr:hypothetical protein [Spirochaetota bacterium]MBN2769317.1 hypothetical protein [Spirochaetota bacterium]HRX15196.1 flagellar filament outer layer protein FlaA [Spirochaetota bacterium]
MKKIAIVLLILIFSVSLYSQDADTPKETPSDDPTSSALGDQIYQEVVLEDFEKTEYSDKDVSIRVTRDQKVSIALRDVFPAPVKDSKKYLGVKVYGRQGDYITVTFPKKLIIEKHCQSISMWVYGKNFSGELSLILQDADKKIHRLSFGKLNFLGWRKLTVRLTKDIRQEDKYLSQHREMAILKLIYNPSSLKRLPSWNFFYVDDISAKVRDKYKDEQDDDW